MALFLPLVVLLSIAIFVYLTKYHLSRRRLYKLAKLIPGNDGLPILGHALNYFGKELMIPFKLFCQDTLDNNGVWKQWFGPTLMMRITNPEDMEIVTNNSLNKANEYRFFQGLVDFSLLHSDVPIWKPHRKLMNYSYSQKILDDYVEIFFRHSETLTKILEKYVGEKPIDIFPFIIKCIADSLSETTLGVKMKAQTENHPYVSDVQKQSQFIFTRGTKFWLHPDWIYRFTPYYEEDMKSAKRARTFISKIVHEKLQEYKENPDFNKDVSEDRYALVEDLIRRTQDTKSWTIQELEGETGIMMAAGNDTTGVAVANVLMMLGHYPEVQRKAFEEQMEIFGDSERPADKDDLLKMNYLEMVVKETLRLIPPIIFIIRRMEKEVDITNYTIPAGANCIIFIIGMHRDTKVWGNDAHLFDPERFLPERSTNRKQISFMTFGYGLRNCIGSKYATMLIKTTVSTVLRKYKLHSDNDHTNSNITLALTQKFTEGVLVSLKKR